MILTNDTTVVFSIPEDNESLQKFMKDFDISQWKRTEVADMICFRKHGFYMIAGREEVEDE